MLNRVRCRCAGRPSCQLCGGTKFFWYEPGPQGWLPFRCPTCQGTGELGEPGIEPEKCPTCDGVGSVDPADPPLSFLVIMRKCLLGG